MERAIDASELMAEIQVCSWDSEQDRERAEDLVLGMPTLTPPNEPLTLEELREMDEPVWVACKPIEGGNGYWCLCQHGHIITPAGSIYDEKEIPHWVFYRRPPEGEEDT